VNINLDVAVGLDQYIYKEKNVRIEIDSLCINI
jgi:hypothetical protein